MPISHKKKIIFIHIPKNAGTSVTTSKELEFSNVEHTSASSYKSLLDFWDEYLKVAIVRNPWDRFVSCYEYARMEISYWHSNSGNESVFGVHPDYEIVRNLTFEELVIKAYTKPQELRHPCWAPQNVWICENNKLIVDKVFRLERLDDDSEFKSIFGEIGTANKSNRRPYAEYYQKKDTIRIIADIYKKDIEMFNYYF